MEAFRITKGPEMVEVMRKVELEAVVAWCHWQKWPLLLLSPRTTMTPWWATALGCWEMRYGDSNVAPVSARQ